jgi:hypothetical protein
VYLIDFTFELLNFAIVSSFFGLCNDCIHCLFGWIGKANMDAIFSEEQGHATSHASAPNHGDLAGSVLRTSIDDDQRTEVKSGILLTGNFLGGQ